MDDYASSQNSEDECFELYRKLKTRFAGGGFNMRKWTSNSEELLQRIENAENTQNVTTSSQNTEIGELCEDDESFAKSTCNAICSEDEVKVLGIA